MVISPILSSSPEFRLDGLSFQEETCAQMRKSLFLMLIMFPFCGHAQEIRDQALHIAHPHRIDREFLIEAVGMGSAWTADTVSTHQLFERFPLTTEQGWFFSGSRSTPKIMAAWAAFDIGNGIMAYEWKRHVRNRYLHPLWRIPMLWRTEAHFQGANSNWSFK